VPFQNRVTPEGGIISDPARGNLMGNRGRIHRPDRTLGRSRWATKAWIACRLEFNDRPPRRIMSPTGYTELFFLDEATAYAAGHRPCAECRRAGYITFRDLWADAFGPAPAPVIDAVLHTARTRRDRTKLTHTAEASGLPDGAMIRTPDGPALILGDAALPWRPSGYGAPRPRPAGPVTVLTPAPVVTLLRGGLPVALHESAARPPPSV
jgi:hypothetical protein